MRKIRAEKGSTGSQRLRGRTPDRCCHIRNVGPQLGSRDDDTEKAGPDNRECASSKTERQKAVLVVEDGRREGHGRGYHANRIENIMTSPPMYREDRLFPPGIDPNKVDEDNLEPVKILYNRTDKLRIGNADEPQEKFALIPKGKEAVWVDDGTKLKLYDGHGPTANKFGEAKYSETHYGSSNAFNVWARYDSYQREWVVYPGKQQNIRYDTKDDLKEDYQFVRGPLYIEKEIDDLPEPEDWSVMILPDAEATFDDPNEKSDDDSDEGKVWYDLDVQFPPDEVPLIYEEGEMRPLIPDGDDLLTPHAKKRPTPTATTMWMRAPNRET